MSTIDEHLAMLEMYKANGEHDLFYTEAHLFTQVHWKEMVAERAPESMSDARATIEARLREQHGERAEQFIQKWREAQSKAKP